MSSWQPFWYKAGKLLCNQPATQQVGWLDAFRGGPNVADRPHPQRNRRQHTYNDHELLSDCRCDQD